MMQTIICSQPLLNYIFFSKGSGMILLFVHCIPLQPQNSLSGNPTHKLHVYAQWHHTAFNFSSFFCLPLLLQASQCFSKRQYTAFVILTFLFCFLSFFPLVRFVKVFMPVLEIRTYGNLLVSGTCTLQIKTNTSHIYNFLCSSNNKLEGWTMLWACKVVVTIN